MKIKSIDELLIAVKETLPNAEVSIINHEIVGKFKGNEFRVTYTPNKTTTITVDESGIFIIEALSNVLSNTGNGTEAVLSYDTVRTNAKREHNLIWSTSAPKEALYNAIILNKIIPIIKLQTKVINVRLYNTETKTMEYISEEDIDSLYRPVAVGGTIKRFIREANLDGLAEKAEDAAKKVVAGATVAADVVVGMLGGKEKVNQTIEDGKKFVVDAYTKAKTGVESMLGDLTTGIENLKEDEKTPEAKTETIEEPVAATPVQNYDSQVKISGIYPGNMKAIVNHIETLDEVGLFLLLEVASSDKRKCLPELIASNNSIQSVNKYKEACYAEEYLVYCTRKFGVDIPEAVEGQKVNINNESFNNWREYFRDYFNDLSKAQKEDFEYRRMTGADTSMYKPSLSWKDHNNIVEMKLRNIQ